MAAPTFNSSNNQHEDLHFLAQLVEGAAKIQDSQIQEYMESDTKLKYAKTSVRTRELLNFCLHYSLIIVIVVVGDESGREERVRSL